MTIAEDAQDLGPAAVRALCFGKALPVVGTALTAVAVGYDIHNGVSVKSAVAAGLLSAGAVVMAAGAVAGAPIGVVVAAGAAAANGQAGDVRSRSLGRQRGRDVHAGHAVGGALKDGHGVAKDVASEAGHAVGSSVKGAGMAISKGWGSVCSEF